jgi:hypothetical protein
VQPEDLRRMMDYLQDLVTTSGRRSIVFEIPDERAMLDAGLDADAVQQLLAAPWLEEMVADVRETPEFCSPEETSDQLLQYARDVVVEYLRKRFVL